MLLFLNFDLGTFSTKFSWPLFAILHFLGPKKGRGSTGTPLGLGSQNTIKKLPHLVDPLGHLLSRNHVSKFFDLGPPLKV